MLLVFWRERGYIVRRVENISVIKEPVNYSPVLTDELKKVRKFS